MFLDQGPQNLQSGRGHVRKRRSNIFAPITTVNDATGAPQTGVAMMQEFARQMERKQGRPVHIVPNMGAELTDLDFSMEACISAVGAREPRAPGK